MKKYIDAEEFKRILIEDKSFYPAIVKNVLENINAANVKEVVNAKWIGRVNMISGDVYYHCSNCGEPNPYEHINKGERCSKFCPKCGSEMKLE